MATASSTERTQSDLAHLIHPLYHPMDHQTPSIWVSGQGAMLQDLAGNEVFDGLSSLWNVNIGHGRRELAKAAMHQMNTLAYCSSYTGSSNLPAINLAERLSRLVYPSINTFFFTSGGAESTESSFKTARFYWKARGKPEKVKLISRWLSYHGATMAAMSATGMSEYWPMFGPLMPNISHIESPYPYRFECEDVTISPGLAAANLLETMILQEGANTVAAFIAEPIQGAGGVLVPPDDYFPRIREICDKYEILLISDEVITGFGRTGSWFGLEHWGIEPDIMQFAKGITSGYIPMGGIGVSDCIKDAIDSTPSDKRWMHAYTYSGHPTCCAVAMANLDVFENEDLIQHAAAMGNYLQEGLHTLANMTHVGDVRGLGMMAAIELVADKVTKQAFSAADKIGEQLGKQLLKRGLYSRMRGDTLCLAPPLITTAEQIDYIVATVQSAIQEVAGS